MVPPRFVDYFFICGLSPTLSSLIEKRVIGDEINKATTTSQINLTGKNFTESVDSQILNPESPSPLKERKIKSSFSQLPESTTKVSSMFIFLS